jgi:undecaprenol kinase/diacylglycerol kinase (ATP)
MLKFFKGFIYAYNGLKVFFAHERNGRIQLLIAIVVVLLGAVLQVSPADWIVLLFCIALVLSLEMMNSAIEKICNMVQPTFHPAVKTIKDISAGAVLWVSVISTIIGGIVLLPKIFDYFK